MKKLLFIGLLTLSIFGFIGTGKASAYSTAGLSMKYPQPHGTFKSQAYAYDSSRRHRAMLVGINTQDRTWTPYYGIMKPAGQYAYSPVVVVWHPSGYVSY